MEKKRCPHCRCYFIPHPSVGSRQRACSKSKCQKLRKAKNNKEWRKQNPKHFKGDYPRVKKWLDAHPGYLKQYRLSHCEYKGKNRESVSTQYRGKKLYREVKEKIIRQKGEIINHMWSGLHNDIQAELMMQPIEIVLVFSHFLSDNTQIFS